MAVFFFLVTFPLNEHVCLYISHISQKFVLLCPCLFGGDLGCLFSPFYNYCINKYNLWSDSSSSNPDDLAKLYDENLQLARCLREKGINVSDPTQQEPKIDFSELDKSKEEISPLLKECGYGELGYEK